MKKLFVYIGLSLVLMISWIYWSSTTEYNNTFLIIKNINFMEEFILSPSNLTCHNRPFLIILVTSYVGHVELRSAHRRAMSPELLDSLNTKRVFLLAKIPETEKYITQKSLEDESKTFSDILQGTFEENYRNLTYKHLMGLKWAATKCSQATFVLKIDDDTVFSLERTYELLQKEKLDNTMLGYMLNNTNPKRSKQNKWYVTYDEYPRNIYPPYLSGWYYITTPKVARMITDEAVFHSKFWIDDILVTGILTEELKIHLKQLPNDYWLEYYELLECCINDMKKHVMCEFVVGPNGNRNNLIYEYNYAMRACNKTCIRRPKTMPLKNSCVAYRERNIYSDGAPQKINVIRL